MGPRNEVMPGTPELRQMKHGHVMLFARPGGPVRIFSGLLLFAVSSVVTQAQPAQAQIDSTQAGQTPQVTMHDGGVTEVLQSIFIPPLQNAPFTATVHTEWVRPLADGGTFTLVNQRRIARDSQGRIYQERWYLVPKDGKMQSRNYLTQISDPVTHTLYNCFLIRMPHRCILESYGGSSFANYRPATGQSGPLPNGDGFRTHEDLGIQDMWGFETVGTRDTTTINQGVNGNDRPYSVMREFWFASSLGIDLRSTISNPSFGKQVFTLSDVSASAPDPALFQVPDGFEVVDQRKPAPPAQ